jgi:hypothetical protein
MAHDHQHPTLRIPYGCRLEPAGDRAERVLFTCKYVSAMWVSSRISAVRLRDICMNTTRICRQSRTQPSAETSMRIHRKEAHQCARVECDWCNEIVPRGTTSTTPAGSEQIPLYRRGICVDIMQIEGILVLLSRTRIQFLRLARLNGPTQVRRHSFVALVRYQHLFFVNCFRRPLARPFMCWQ